MAPGTSMLICNLEGCELTFPPPAGERIRRFCSTPHRKLAYERTPKGRARGERFDLSERGQARRDRHEAVRGYLRKRTRQLEALRERTLTQLEQLEREAECLTS